MKVGGSVYPDRSWAGVRSGLRVYLFILFFTVSCVTETRAQWPGVALLDARWPALWLATLAMTVLLFVLLLRERAAARRLRQTISSAQTHLQSIEPALQHSPVMLYGLDESLNIVFWNNKLTEVTGWTMQAVQADPEKLALLLPQRKDVNAPERWLARESRIHQANGRDRVLALSYERNRLPLPIAWWGVAVEVTRRVMSMDLLQGERAVLHAVTSRKPLEAVLELVIEMIQHQIPNALASVLLLDETGNMFIKAMGPKLPREYHAAIVGLRIGEGRGSCGTSAWRGERVIVEDIQTDPLWADFKDLAGLHGLGSCWSTPFKSRDERVLGTFAIYHRAPQSPTPHELTLIETAADLTALIVGHYQAEQAQQQMALQIQQAQKMESLSVLAGGIAHDFNNLLMGILGNVDLGLQDLPPDSPVNSNLLDIQRAAEKAADLSHQMLAYSGRGRFMPERINLNTALAEMEAMIRGNAARGIEIEFVLGENLPSIEVDAAQLRQAVMNLVINAGEAIEGGRGRITIRTQIAHCSRSFLSETFLDDRLAPGVYISLEVADTGVGMDEETRMRIFDPFFTLKFPGRGLGLPSVLGIVRGHKGAIKVESAIGQGTTVRVLFPITEGIQPAMEQRITPANDWAGSGLVLIADDEEAVLKVSKHMVERMGFSVVTARDGVETIEVFKQHAQDLVCALLDLTMPHKGGEDCLREIGEIRPDLPVIVSSGYNQQEVLEQCAGQRIAGFIQKPYQIGALRERLREAVESAGD
jgi:signal transduction histidine kinase/PAS domain-containing protein